MLAVGSAFAAPETPRSRLASVIRDFDAPTPQERATASERAQADMEFTLSLLEEVLTAPRATPLSPEQVMRLEQIARQRFLTEPRAAMGVQFSQLENITEGVEISAPLPGFDSMRVLQPGDVITTGTPAGVGLATKTFLKAGDVVTLGMSGLGEQRQQVVKYKAAK
jgi:hypothetical protein